MPSAATGLRMLKKAQERKDRVMTVLDWLLDSDPAIRWQAMLDLTDAPDDAVAAERSRVASEGWGALLLGRQSGDGRWLLQNGHADRIVFGIEEEPDAPAAGSRCGRCAS